MRLFRSFNLVIPTVIAAVAMLACEADTAELTVGEPHGTQLVEQAVSPEISVLAHRLVTAYMSDKDWGFFGATCEQWIEEDYQWQTAMGEIQPDGRIKVTYVRNPDRILGPELLMFYVDIDTGEVEGDNESETGRSSVAEGCDKW